MVRQLIHKPTMTLPVLPSIAIQEHALYCKADSTLVPDIAEALKFIRPHAKPTQFGTKIKQEDAYYIHRGSGKFLYGLMDRATAHLGAIGRQFNITGMQNVHFPAGQEQEAKLNGITFRQDQVDLIRSILRSMRGVIVSPTGSGKTLIALGAVSCWPEARALILVHRLDILKQFEERAAMYLPGITQQTIKGGKHPVLTAQLVMSTIQSIYKYPMEEIYSKFDIMICDECHHVSDRKSQFGDFMLYNIAPVKIGFTATVPDDQTRVLAMEGILGPVIGQLTEEEGRRRGIVAKPYVTLITVPYDHDIGSHTTYKALYDAGIVNNRARNARITKLAKERASRGLTSLTIIRTIKHGEILEDFAKRLGLNSLFVYSGTTGGMRDKAVHALNSKEVANVICTDVWREGIDIPTLNCVIMAASGKSPLQTRQGVGRGTRATEGKDSMEIIDFLDPYKYLARHAVLRLIVYVEQGWM
ncbi:hypothetical protein LCGC14_1240770 [marine sediment metagenome]|uniref:Helicase ATP-binding domain-containing protein n=1 Tax=marine sediment metagenome TaxID=412755 RepID=A0A0F9PA38_9ZZZZ